MKFRFEDQPHQGAAIAAVVDLFEGALTPPLVGIVGQAPGAVGHNGFTLDRAILSDRLGAVSEREEGVDKQSELHLLEVEADLQGEARDFPNFSVEMETGTGKTYVYINTALQLAQTHGLRKFVILVHSVAIRAGVVKTFEQTEEHFRAKFPSLPYKWGVIGEGPALDDFLEPSSTVQFLVASVQAIDKPDTGVVYGVPEQPQLWGDSESGMNSIAATHPVVIVDEPQNFKTDLRKRAIATLNPLFVLRYSATHAEKFNLVHVLGPKAATEQGLVKRVSVKGIAPGATGKAYLRVDKIRTKAKRLFAEVMIDVDSASGLKRTDVVLRNGDDLYDVSGGLDQYRGLVVERFERKPDRVIFENGTELRVGEETGVDRMSIWQEQIRHTIRAHLNRQNQIDATGREVKVLSLFFVEHVADYWPVEGQPEPVLPSMFDALYREEWVRAGGRPETCPDPSTLRVHYFPSTKTGIFKDSTGSSAKAQEEQARAYAEIIANKELILTKDNPHAYIFSHSALKEGWDNPNVFQVGFLRHSASEVERRQQIGRGLRLPVDETGARVTDPATCRLTLVVDETFSEFRDGLNKEYAATGGGGGPEPDDDDNTVQVRRRSKKFLSPEFQALWSRIRYKARYRIRLDSSVLPAAVGASEQLEEIRYLAKRANIVQTAELRYDDGGKVITTDTEVAESSGASITIVGQQLPDLVRLVEDQLLTTKFPLQLTRPTVAAIIAAVPSNLQARAIDDPERWARIVASAIRTVTIEEMVEHIGYEPEPEADWWDAEVVFVEVEEQNPPQPKGGADPKNGVVAAPEGGLNLYDHVIYDSHVEREFAAMLENDEEHIKLFAKLPRRFRVRTPVGEYSPDWAIVYDDKGTERLYLVRETKGTLNLDDLHWDEAMRIRFARRHFEVAPAGKIDYQFTTAQTGLRVNADWADSQEDD
ncbi:restriction endonuclease [Nocardia gamkensis]|uniref:DEAD/DEAH box helicase family protein n=1 Tax=Nocardia gamkensis TaxID=352869 RepID=A0A7X6R797_9NOCA|nr:DEAD/DEAH box helicase family protein [Nocardia gamkensis]NKY31374.1 DEAD/DEAH box helicase family protein [Nocardia gamkensis]NQE72443.1 Type III restriction-modification system enzyme res [Nocardia gamkensis]